eukprot:m51a1_g10225 putative adenylate cyclase (735) ;mRNA; r:137020-139287
MRRIGVSAGTASAAISLATSVVLVGVVVSLFATVATQYSLALVARNVDTLLDAHADAVAGADARAVLASDCAATLFLSRALPAASDAHTSTAAALYWQLRRASHVLRLAYAPAGDPARFVAVGRTHGGGGIVVDVGTASADPAEARVAQYAAAEGAAATGGVVLTWRRNSTAPAQAWALEQQHAVERSAETGELVVARAVRVPGGVLGLWSSVDDLSRALRADAAPGARVLVADADGRLVAASHGAAYVDDGPQGQRTYLAMGDSRAGDSAAQDVGRAVLRAGLLGREVRMRRAAGHIVSSRAVAVGGARWTVYYALPESSALAGVRTTVGVCVGIAAGLALAAAALSWSAQHVLLARPLGFVADAFETLARLNMHGIAEAEAINLPAVVAISMRELSQPAARRLAASVALGDVLSEVAEVLEAADRMVHSLYCVGRYVSMDLATWVIGKGVAASPLRQRDVSVLFCDIVGFTAMTDRCREQSCLAEFADLLSEFLTELADTAKLYEGYIDKFIGDKVMVVFNALAPCANHQSRACEAAVAMQGCVQKLQATWRNQGRHADWPCPLIRVAVASGAVLVGDVGAFGTLVNYTAIGETVCVASRLQEVSKFLRPVSAVLVTGDTWGPAAAEGAVSLVTDEDARGGIVGHSCGATTVRGCSEKLAVYALLGCREAQPRVVLEGAAHLQRSIECLARGDGAACAKELAAAGDVYLPALKGAIAAAMENHTSVLHLSRD